MCMSQGSGYHGDRCKVWSCRGHAPGGPVNAEEEKSTAQSQERGSRERSYTIKDQALVMGLTGEHTNYFTKREMK